MISASYPSIQDMVTGKCFPQPVKEYVISNFLMKFPFLVLFLLFTKLFLTVNKNKAKMELIGNYW